jgi:hypothetical protein
MRNDRKKCKKYEIREKRKAKQVAGLNLKQPVTKTSLRSTIPCGKGAQNRKRKLCSYWIKLVRG